MSLKDFFRKRKLMLIEEDNIRNKMNKILRSYNLILRIIRDEKDIIDNCLAVSKDINVSDNTKISAQLVVKRKALLSFLNKEISSVQNKLNRKLRFIFQNVKLGKTEREMIGNILDIKGFDDLNIKEKELLEEMVFKQKDKLQNLVVILGDLTNKIEIESNFLKILVEEIKKTPNSMNSNTANITLKISEVKENLHYQEKIIQQCTFIVQELEKEAKRVAKENKNIESDFSPEDIRLAQEIVGVDLKKQKDKYEVMLKALQKQRVIRSDISVHNLIAVHFTDTFPKNGVIKPSVHYSDNSIFSNISRGTIHFALNGPVGSHMYGNWSNKKYAILIPIPLILERLIVILDCDTFIFGELKLPRGSEVLAKEEDISNINSGDAVVIPINMIQDLNEEVLIRIRNKGYTPMNVGMYSWNSAASQEDYDLAKFMFNTTKIYGFDSCDKFYVLADKIEIDCVGHCSTPWSKIEDAVISISYGMQDHPDDFYEIHNALDWLKENIKKTDEYSKKFIFKEEKETYKLLKKKLEKLMAKAEKHLKNCK